MPNISDNKKDSQQHSQEKTTETKNKHTKKYFLWIFVLTIVLITIASVYFIINTNLNKKSENEIADANRTKSGFLVDENNVNGKQGPMNVVTEFMNYNLENDRNSARKLLSINANKEAFSSTISGSNGDSSLYGKDFTFEIYDIYMQNNNTKALVSVSITLDNKSFVDAFTLENDGNTWLLTNMESYTTF